jgi:sulfatase maturation enzyme AslB (radical SAM superfamily)
MANPNVFCNTPWYEAHIYWDGSLGICCQESRKIHSDDEKYNIRNMTLSEWFNSEPVRQLRKDILGNDGVDVCSRCYNETEYLGTSRRHRSNQKSVIFTKQAFDESFTQSPGYDHFKFSEGMDGLTNTLPIDLHIDLGNHCNLACKMCWPGASTRIAGQYVKWGMPAEKYLGVDWTRDSVVWNKFLNDLLAISKLKNIHFMGGETLLSPRFEELVDWMIANGRFDVNFSFVTNGTVYKPELIEKLKQFPRVGIEISIETTTKHNDYIRQGSKVEEVIENIRKYKQLCSGSDVSVTLRPAISVLSIGYYHTLLRFALEEQLLIKSLTVTDPFYLNPNLLPQTIRNQYLIPYIEILEELKDVNINVDYNESDRNNYYQSVKQQAQQIKLMLYNEPVKAGSDELFLWCSRWDREFGFNMLALYPEFKELYENVQS